MMATQEKEFRPLTGRGIRKGRFFAVAPTRSRLWLAKDHLLCVDNNHFSENYRRFYYKDILAVTIRKTYRWEIWNIVWGALAVVTAGVAHIMGDAIYLWSMEGVFCLSLVINLLRGPSCVCHLYTSVHTEEMPSLGRLKNALKARERLYPLIQQAQGELAAAGIQDLAAEVAKKMTDRSFSRPLRSESRGISSGYQGGVHKFLFALLLLTGIVNLILLHSNHVGTTLLNITLGIGLFISVIVSIVRQYEVQIRAAVRTLTWATLGYMTVVYVLAMMRYIVVAATNPNIANNQWELIRVYSTPSPVESPLLHGLRILYIVCSFVLAIPGLVLSLKSSRRRGR